MSVLFESWAEVGRTALSALLMYPLVVAWVRIFGKRSTSKMNNFDWIVTVAMGSMVGSAIVLRDVAVLEVALGITVLLAWKFISTYAMAHWDWATRLLMARPTLLYYDGGFDETVMHHQRVSKEEVIAAARMQGFRDLSEVGAVVLESNARLSVLSNAPNEEESDRVPPVLESVQTPHVDMS